MHTTTLSDAPPRPVGNANAVTGPAGRIASIDLLRGVTILLMIFVNDIAGVTGMPGWLLHYEPYDADGMTFVDVIFPAFLFIVGMSIPFALRRRLGSGEPMWRVWQHVLRRTIALLIIGVFMVNSGALSDEALLSHSAWTMLMYLGVILVWSNWPSRWSIDKTGERALLAVGIVLLLAMAVIFRGPGEPSLVELRPQWWGILGLIGWAYLVGCAAYLILRTNVAALIGTMVLLYCLFIADAAGALSGIPWINSWISLGSMIGTHGAVTVSGLVLGVILLPGSPVSSQVSRIRWGLVYGLMLAIGAIMMHAGRTVDEMFIINKTIATPPWGLWSSAITVWTWVAIYWLIDVRGYLQGTRTLVLSGRNALFAYILAPIVYSGMALIASILSMTNYYWVLGTHPASGLVRGVALAVVICVVTAALTRSGYSLRV